jgi:hypothetical protein
MVDHTTAQLLLLLKLLADLARSLDCRAVTELLELEHLTDLHLPLDGGLAASALKLPLPAPRMGAEARKPPGPLASRPGRERRGKLWWS